MLKVINTDISQYLKSTEEIDFEDPLVRQEISKLSAPGLVGNELVKKVYEYVRDVYPHSLDMAGPLPSQVSRKASDVIRNRHGLCYAKSHLLAAILRGMGIPSGFCYQKLIFSEYDPKIVLHALNAVYLSEAEKWIRLDARGNKPGFDAQFSLNGDKLAFPIRPELGEEDGTTIYSEPSKNVIAALRTPESLEYLIHNLPESV